MQFRWHPPLQIELLPRGRVLKTRVLPVPGTSASSVQHPYPHKELLWVLYDIHTRTLNFCNICTTVPQYPGYGYLPGTSGSSANVVRVPIRVIGTQSLTRESESFWSTESLGYHKLKWLSPRESLGYWELKWLSPRESLAYWKLKWLSPRESRGYWKL